MIGIVFHTITQSQLNIPSNIHDFIRGFFGLRLAQVGLNIMRRADITEKCLHFSELDVAMAASHCEKWPVFSRQARMPNHDN